MFKPNNEKDLIKYYERYVDNKNNLLGHDDDAVAINLSDSKMVINIDGWVESTDRPNGMSPFGVGYRAVCNAASDVIAKGAKPTGMIISMTLDEKHWEQFENIIDGFKAASSKYNISYLGGDTNKGKDLVIDVVVWGTSEKLVKRRGIQENDLVCWIGDELGRNAAALGVLTKDWKGEKNIALSIMENPNLYLNFIEINANSSIDCSDGLAFSLYQLIRNTKYGIKIDNNIINYGDEWAVKISQINDIELSELIFYGGEELGIVFTCSSKTYETMKRKYDIDIKLLGVVNNEEGVYYDGEKIQNKGWDHFN